MTTKKDYAEFLELNMPRSKKKKKKSWELKKTTVLITWLAVYTIDYITTVIALNLPSLAHKGLYEANPIAAAFFSLGWVGWVFSFIFSMGIIVLLVEMVFYLKPKAKALPPNFLPLLSMGMIVTLDGLVIINNIRLMVT